MGSSYRPIGRGIGVVTNKSGSSYRVHFVCRGQAYDKILDIPVSRKNDRLALQVKSAVDVHARAGELESINKHLKVPVISVRAGNLNRELTDYLERVRASHPHSTFQAYNRAVNQLLKHLSGHTVQGLAEDPAPIYDMIEAWGQDKTLKTIRNYLGPLRDIFARARIKQHIRVNPLADFKPSSLVKGSRSNYRIDPYTEQEVLHLVEYAAAWGPYIQAQAYTGLRPSEMMGLKWQDVDLRQQRIAVERAVVERKLKDTKTEGSRRLVDLSDMAMEAFQRQRESSQLAGGRVWLNPATGEPLRDYEEITRALKDICKRAGVRYRSSEQLRHTYATNRIIGGANLFDIADQMGHRNRKGQVSIEMLLKHYGTYIRQMDGMTGSYGNRAASGSETQATD